MKLKYLTFLLLCSFCFFYTEKIALNIKNQNPIMKDINEITDSKYVASIDSTLIDELYIIPGLNGKEINVDKSFNNMKSTESFSDELLVFDQIKPDVSLEENKNRIIIRGNSNKNSVAIIFEEKNTNAEYLFQKNYHVNIMIKSENEVDVNYEVINVSQDEKNFKSLDKILTKKNLNTNICYIKDTIPSFCNDKYLFKPSMTINQSNLAENKNKISSGEIILIKNTLSLSELEILIRQIEYKDLKIVPLSELISEIN